MSAERSHQNWRHMLEWSSDSAQLVFYEVSQLMKVLLGDAPLDTGTEYNVGLVGQLLCIVCEERAVYAAAADTAVKSIGEFLEFLVRCHNTRPTQLIRDVECRVAALLYELASILEPNPAVQEQIAPYVPFLMHASFVQLKMLRKSDIKIFGLPPRHNAGRSLCEMDSYIWLSTSLLELVSTSYFTQLLGYCGQDNDRQLQVAFVYELLDQSAFLLQRSFESLYAVPLNIKSPSKRGCAEPKVVPSKVLSFLSLGDVETDLTPPTDYTTEGQDEQEEWVFSSSDVDRHAALLLHRMESLGEAVYTSTNPNHGQTGPRRNLPPGVSGLQSHDISLRLIVPLQVRFVCGCLFWLLVTLLASITNLIPIGDDSPVVALWRCSVSNLIHTITLYSHHHRCLPPSDSHMLTTQLFKASLHVIAIDQAFAAYFPQGSFDATPLTLPKGAVLRDIQAEGRPCSLPLLHLLSRCHASTLYAAFAGSGEERVGGASRPPLELSIATCLHTLFMTHLGVSQVSDLGSEKREAAAVPVQNIFRGLHTVLTEVVGSAVWRDIFTSSGTQASRVNLAPNWLKATEISKGFAALPFGRDVQRNQVDTVSQNAWTLVHYYFQLSIPCAPTAPPSQISILRPGKGWDDYEEYFAEMERELGDGERSLLEGMRRRGPAGLFPQDFGLTDVPGQQGYRLRQLLSSHLRGILTVIPYFRILFVINKRECNMDSCAYYCSSLADLITFSAHNHGVAVPFLRTALECYENVESDTALATAEKLEKIFLEIMDQPSAALVQSHARKLALQFSTAPSP